MDATLTALLQEIIDLHTTVARLKAENESLKAQAINKPAVAKTEGK